jgi:hypothetical protein
VAGVTLAAAACNRPAALTQLVDAQARTAALHAALTTSIDASNRAVMATDDKTATDGGNESRDADAAVDRQIPELRQVLEALHYEAELTRLDSYQARFDEYRRFNEDILSLVLENSNVKAQRLSFGPSAEAAEAFRQAIEAAVAVEPVSDTCAARERAARAWTSLLEIRVLYPRHIAEADDAEMTRLETTMNGAAAAARAALDELARQLPASSRWTDAKSALDRFMSIHAQIVDLSRRNSNVRALALSLGKKRTAAAAAVAELSGLQEALRSHGFNATR